MFRDLGVGLGVGFGWFGLASCFCVSNFKIQFRIGNPCTGAELGGPQEGWFEVGFGWFRVGFGWVLKQMYVFEKQRRNIPQSDQTEEGCLLCFL